MTDFILWFAHHVGAAGMIAVPALVFLIFNPPSKWRNDP